MKRLDFDEFFDWCVGHGYELRQWRLSLPGAESWVEFVLPADPHALPEVLDELVAIRPGETEWVVWLRDWTVWGERSQGIGLAHVATLARGGLGCEVAEGQHIYRFHADEWRVVVAFLTVPALYGWDAHLLFGSGSALVNIDHEGKVMAFSSDKDSPALDRCKAAAGSSYLVQGR